MKKSIAPAVMMIFFIPSLSAQVDKKAQALKIADAIVVDGALAEPAWEKAAAITDFIQFQPDRGKPGSLKTVVKILYDRKYIYFGFFCDDPQPDRIAAHQSKRDSDLTIDDSVAICLDTFHDRRNCYYFLTNLAGTQYDGRITENGLTTDSTWDGVWKSAGRRTDTGWTAEIAIAFASLKYNPGKEVAWGLGLARVMPRALEADMWTGPVESPYKVSQYGELAGLSLEKADDRAQIIPHVVAKLEEGKAAEAELGVDARYAFSQSISGNLTVNPDFATVEADQEQINLTRYELNLPEKRNFFLEGSEIYKQRIQLFYSRRIGDIWAAAKVYGKTGGIEFSGLSAQTKENEAAYEDSANFSAVRLKGDVFKSSTIGFLAANKLVDGKNRGTAGFDTSLYFTDTLKFTGQLAVSYGDYNKDNFAFFLRPSYDSATFHFHIRYTHLGSNYGDNANAVAFITDDNRRELDSALEKTFWLKKWGLERIQYQSNYNIFWGMDSTLRSWQVDESLSADLKNKFSLGVKHTQEYKLFEKGFWNNKTSFNLGYNTREWQSAELVYSFGRNFDQDFQLVEGGLNYKLTKDFSLEYSLTRLIYDPDPQDRSTWIHVIRATNYFTNDLFLKVFYQINSTIAKKYIQVLFVYRFEPPFGLVQLAYQKGSARFGERGNQGHTLFLKVAYMF